MSLEKDEETRVVGECERVRNTEAIGELGLWVGPCLPSTSRILPHVPLVKI